MYIVIQMSLQDNKVLHSIIRTKVGQWVLPEIVCHSTEVDSWLISLLLISFSLKHIDLGQKV